MSAPEEFGDVVADLLTWVRQNETAEGAWYLDEGPVAGAESVTVPENDTTEKPVANPTATPATEPVATEDPFAAECQTFVAKAMALIADQSRDSTVVPLLRGSAAETDHSGALETLRTEVLPCTACDLHQTRHNVVFGAGSPEADLVIVGEAPGHDEDLQGIPFVGRSGQLLTKILSAIGLARDDVFICNILKCRPPQNRDPLPQEVLACEPYLRRQLEIIRPRVICCLGRVAAQTLLKTATSLGRLRGGVHFYHDIPVMATYHPAYLLRNPAAKRDTWNDIRKMKALMDVLAGGDSRKGEGNA